MDFIDHEESQSLHEGVIAERSTPPSRKNLYLFGSRENNVKGSELFMQLYSESFRGNANA